MTLKMEIVSCCRLKAIDLSPQINPRFTFSTKNSMRMRPAAAGNDENKAVSYSMFRHTAARIILPNRNIMRSMVIDNARASWKPGGLPFGFITLLNC